MAENDYKWYVLRVISGKENKVREYIESALQTSSLFKEYVSQVLIPTEKVVVLRRGKRTIKERNKLPGYVLVECNLTDECYPLLRNIPNVLGFLSDGRTDTKPAPVSQSEINKMVGIEFSYASALLVYQEIFDSQKTCTMTLKQY